MLFYIVKGRHTATLGFLKKCMQREYGCIHVPIYNRENAVCAHIVAIHAGDKNVCVQTQTDQAYVPLYTSMDVRMCTDA